MAVACDAFRTPDEYQGVIIIEELDCRLIAKLFCCITSLIKNRTWSSELVLVFFIGYMHMVGNNIVNGAHDSAADGGEPAEPAANGDAVPPLVDMDGVVSSGQVNLGSRSHFYPLPGNFQVASR